MWLPKSWQDSAGVASPSGQDSWPVPQSHRAKEKSGSCASSPTLTVRDWARVASWKAAGTSVGSCCPSTSTVALEVKTRRRMLVDTVAGKPASSRVRSHRARCSSSPPIQRSRAVRGPAGG